MWRNWNPLNPPINDQSSGEDHDYESAGENDPNNLVSPNRPHQSPTASPRALLRPDPPPVEEVLQEVQQQLRSLPTREERAANRNAVREAQRAAEEAAGNMPLPVTFENANGVDDDGALATALRNLSKFEFDLEDIEFTFNQLEIKMTTSGVKKQYTKFQVLGSIIPKKIQDQVKSLLRKDEAAYTNNNAYKLLKQKILTIFGQSCEASFDRALQRTLTGTPSELARTLVNDICGKELDGCCCIHAVASLWKRALPLAVKQSISHMEFTKDTFDAVVATADKVWQSSRPSGITVAALTQSVAALTPAAESIQETMNQAFVADPGDPVQVAAQSIVAAVQKFSRGRGQSGGRGNRGGRGRGNRGGRGGGQNQGQGKDNKNRWSNLTKHADNPPSGVCRRHYVFGKSAHWCEEPATCPWKDFFVPKNQ